MAPNHSPVIGYLFSDTNRYSPRIFNKSQMKFDVSLANDKIGFMRSLNLLCVSNSKEFQSKLNWDVVSPGTVLPVKKCSVVLTGVNHNTSGGVLNNQTDHVHHNNLHCKLNLNERKSNDSINDIFQEQRINKTSCTQSIDANILKSIDQTESVAGNPRKRKYTNGVTLKVTLKIGDEVISKKYCKKKYLNKENLDKQLSNRIHSEIDCEKFNDIKNSVRTSKTMSNITNCDQVCMQEPNAELRVQIESRKKSFLANALVEFELHRQSLQSTESHISESEEQSDEIVENMNNNNIHEKEDAVVPDRNETTSNVIEDDVQQNLQTTSNLKKTKNSCINTFQQNRLFTDKNYEIITIDDDNCDDTLDDCVIVDEYLSHDYLKDKEQSYDFHVTDTNTSILKKRTTVEIQRNYCFDDGRTVERQKLQNIDS